MAVALVQEFPIEGDDRTTTNFDAVQERLGTMSAPGLVAPTAGFDEQAGVFRIFAVWDSEADWERFRDERLMPTVQPMVEAGGRPPTAEYLYELHHVAKP